MVRSALEVRLGASGEWEGVDALLSGGDLEVRILERKPVAFVQLPSTGGGPSSVVSVSPARARRWTGRPATFLAEKRGGTCWMSPTVPAMARASASAEGRAALSSEVGRPEAS